MCIAIGNLNNYLKHRIHGMMYDKKGQKKSRMTGSALVRRLLKSSCHETKEGYWFLSLGGCLFEILLIAGNYLMEGHFWINFVHTDRLLLLNV